MQLILAEKPSVARDLARVLGVKPSGKTQFEAPGRVITWCVGHLAELEEPAKYDARWKQWRLDTLPMIPARFALRPSTSAPEQFRAVRALLRDGRFQEVVNACDAGREGELIFRYAYELAGSRLPVRRLWISSLTDEAIRHGFARLRPRADFDGLADAARCRSEADWLVGLNATRALTARARGGDRGTLYSIGRVQTPTLALLVGRERAIREFVPEDYWELRGTFATAQGERFAATFTHERRTRLATAALADALAARDRAHARASDPHGPRVERVEHKTVREPAPLLFDLTSLQRTANRRFGLSAARTLELAQALYETHKVLTYPRTDARHLTRDIAKDLPKLFGALAAVPEYKPFADPLLAQPPAPSRRVFDDDKVGDHHAIVPTGRAVDLAALDRDERRVFDLVARRFLGIFHPDAEFAQTVVTVRVGPGDGVAPVESVEPVAPAAREGDGAKETAVPKLTALPAPPDRFVARGRVRLRAGWQEVAGIGPGDEGGERAGAGAAAEPRLPVLAEGSALDGTFEPLAKKTAPPQRHTEATLLAAMESAGKTIDDEALRLAMRDCGLGTPATRAAVIETLLKRGYVGRDKKQLVPTPLGEALVTALPVESLASAELTGQWEARLARMARGEESRAAFMADIARYVAAVVDTIRDAPPPATQAATADGPRVGRCPRCGAAVVERARAFACGAGARPCGFEVPKIVAGRAISAALAAVLLGRGRTQRLRGFRSRAGKPFAAALALESDGTVRLDFAPEGAAQGSAPRDEPDARSRRAPPVRATRTPAESAPAARAPATPATTDGAPLPCPRCREGTLVTGRRGWGCSRWREGCALVIWFDAAGKRVTEGQLRELVTRGRTRKGRWTPGHGPPVAGRLVLDPATDGGAVRFVAE